MHDEFACRGEDEGGGAARDGGAGFGMLEHALEHGDEECGRFSGSGLSPACNVVALHGPCQGGGLNGRAVLEPEIGDGMQNGFGKIEFLEACCAFLWFDRIGRRIPWVIRQDRGGEDFWFGRRCEGTGGGRLFRKIGCGRFAGVPRVAERIVFRTAGTIGRAGTIGPIVHPLARGALFPGAGLFLRSGMIVFRLAGRCRFSGKKTFDERYERHVKRSVAAVLRSRFGQNQAKTDNDQ